MHNNIYEQKYAQENVLVNVERSYLFNGFDVLFDAKLYMAQDVKFNNSYSAMMPTYKEYGNCMMLYNMDGTTTYAKTLLYGNGNDCITRGFRTTKVDCWGENNPAYHMTVEILNPDDQLMSANPSSGYAALRDMLGGVENKIYFSTFSNKKTLVWGTELNYKTKYTFSYQPDFKNPTAEPDVMIVTP